MRDESRRISLQGFILWSLDRINIVLIPITGSFILYTRSAGVVYFSAGAVVCTLSVKCIKQVLRHTRPVQANHQRQKQTYGMPSTHAAAITFYGTYILLACAWLPLHASLPENPLFRPFVAMVAVPWTCAVASSRILLGHHTTPQVVVGLIYGVIFACVWFWLWTHGLNDWGWIVEQYVRAYIG